MTLKRSIFSLAAASLASALPQASYGSTNDTNSGGVNDPTNPILDLGYAKYQGSTEYVANYSQIAYMGIYFAAPPTGQNRWRAPIPIEQQNDYDPDSVMNATAPGPICVQGTPAWQLTDLTTVAPQQGVEDCLVANVFVPTNPTSDSLPIVVGIHGGGYTQGSAMNGQAIVAAAKGDVIWVAVQYRLGAYGFLSSEEIKENGAANAGLLDQRLGIEWAQRYARSFGGDPAKITIWGGSAGGGSVMSQMILYGGVENPPFRAAIPEYPWWQPFKNDSTLEAQYRALLTATDCTGLECLRAAPADALNVASQSTYQTTYTEQPLGEYGYGDFFYGPSVDGAIIRDLPSNEFKQGHFSKVAMLVDRDQYEGYVFSNQSETTSEEQLVDFQELWPYAKNSFFDRLYELYPASDFNSTFWQRQTIYGDFIIDCPTYYMASATSDWGLPTYKLIFNAGSQLHAATGEFLTAFPESEVSNHTLSHIMKEWFISFVTDLDPNARSYFDVDKPSWPLYNPNGPSNTTDLNWSVMDVNYTMIGVVRDFDVSCRCDFFHGQSYVVRN